MSCNFAPGDLVRARNREWVALPSPDDSILALRPLSGSEGNSIILDPSLETLPVCTARFDLPADAKCTVQTKALLLADALRLTLRRGAGPFRSAAQLTFEPRTYQLVPLLMALRLQIPRILIADAVGIGKTIEAGLILRELMDRGEVESFSVLCPPHLVEQWTQELQTRFGIEAVAITSSTATKLERKLPFSQTLFDAYPHTIVSLDYIKADKRRDSFARTCPKFIIVDEAHACVGTYKGKQQRFKLLSGLAQDEKRGIIMLTATPHSGDEDAFSRLLSLIDKSFSELNFTDEEYRKRLARHFVQRRRIDLEGTEWQEQHTFPKHDPKDVAYRLSPDHLDFQESVLKYCFGIVSEAGSGQHERRLAFWGTLALMRCVGSSPAAALGALKNRASKEGDRLENQIYDEDGDDEDAVDIEPSATLDDSTELGALIRKAEELAKNPDDPKLTALIREIKPFAKKGANIVVFCRFIATAGYVCKSLRQQFPKAIVEEVTGLLTPDERRDRVADMVREEDEGEKQKQRILVATDCLSEGINLQQFFDTVIHYDLSWNPTRHQQREGRVDRFGQPASKVHSIMMFSSDSAIDGAVLEVILRKAKDIRKATGVSVPLPEDRGPVTDALMNAMMLRCGTIPQLSLDLHLSDGTKFMETYWRNTTENEKRSRSRFAQNAMKPGEVAPQWEKVRSLLGSPSDVKFFIQQAMSNFGRPLEKRKSLLLAHVGELDKLLKERLSDRGLQNTIRLAETEPTPSGATLLTRTHPLTMTLAESLLEASLEPESLPSLGIGRVGAWSTTAVQQMTRLVLLRIRYKLTIHARRECLLLAEEAALVAIAGKTILARGEEARELLKAQATSNTAPSAQQRFVTAAQQDLPTFLEGPLADFVKEREKALQHDHESLRTAVSQISRVDVKAITPPDVIGLFTLLPGET